MSFRSARTRKRETVIKKKIIILKQFTFLIVGGSAKEKTIHARQEKPTVSVVDIAETRLTGLESSKLKVRLRRVSATGPPRNVLHYQPVQTSAMFHHCSVW